MNRVLIILVILIITIIIFGIILKNIILAIIVPKKENIELQNKKQKIKLTSPEPKIINTPEFIIYIP